jgi:DNA-directed RNA polymerase specialized sigma24 family protein
MKDPAHIANDVVREALSPFFHGHDHPLPDNLGRELYCTLRGKLHRAGLGGDDHAQEIFSMALVDACDYLKRHSAKDVRLPRPWLHRICYTAFCHYLESLRPKDAPTLTPLLEGEVGLQVDAPVASEERIMEMVREEIERLAPRFRRFLWLDLVEMLPPEEIQELLGVTEAYFRKLKCQALAALKDALEKRL